MDDMQAFEQRTNETRQRIGKPPVVPYSDQRIPDDKRLYSWIRPRWRLAGRMIILLIPPRHTQGGYRLYRVGTA